MDMLRNDDDARALLARHADKQGLDIKGGRIRRTSSRFCLGVEHGDYNGTDLFGIGTDRFFWLGYKPNGTGEIRLFSVNFPDDGVVTFRAGDVPPPRSPEWEHSSARFPFGVDYILRREGYDVPQGYDAVICGNIPGGGMSRSASLSINLILTAMEVNGIPVEDEFKIVEMAQAVENDYIGSPCGLLDQIMIYFAREGMGTYYSPKDRTITHLPLGKGGEALRLVVLDTGTVRPGLEKSTYKIRRDECERLVEMAGEEFGITCLADVRDEELYGSIMARCRRAHNGLCDRLTYIYEAQQRFGCMMDAWKSGDIATVGAMFRADGIGLRDMYDISGPELETMCDLARTIPGVLGERMLGGGDKGAAGALVHVDAVEPLRHAVETGYPRSRPEQADRYAMHVCKVVDGVKVLDGI